MIEKIRKFYMNKTLFIVAAVLTVCGYLGALVLAVKNGNASDYIWLFLGLALLLLWAFFYGQINVQKMLFGAVMIAMIETQCELFEMNSASGAQTSAILNLVCLVLSIVIFVSHLHQQMDHKGKSLSTLINQLLGLVAVLFLISVIMNLLAVPAELEQNIFYLGYIFNCIMVICMETRVEEYKQIRDKARSEGTWSEENKLEAKKLFKL